MVGLAAAVDPGGLGDPGVAWAARMSGDTDRHRLLNFVVFLNIFACEGWGAMPL